MEWPLTYLESVLETHPRKTLRIIEHGRTIRWGICIGLDQKLKCNWVKEARPVSMINSAGSETGRGPTLV